MDTNRPVLVKRMPERLNYRQARAFWDEVHPIITSDRPQLVLDMSSVKHLDAAGVDMLLKCMAEVMKRDGDLKLAAVSPEAGVILEMTRTDRFFEIYESSTAAVRSFSRFTPEAMQRQPFSATASTASSPSDEQDPGLAA